jgi:hypothetical protein
MRGMECMDRQNAVGIALWGQEHTLLSATAWHLKPSGCIKNNKKFSGDLLNLLEHNNLSSAKIAEIIPLFWVVGEAHVRIA